MDAPVVDILITLPNRRASGFTQGPSARRPQAQVTFSCEQGHSRTFQVPTRVAKAFQKDEPDLPVSFDRARDTLFALERRCCLAHLVEMLSRREHAEAEVRRKLVAFGYHADAIDAAVELARDLRFLDDRRFVSSFVEERKRRGWGRRKIERELAQRGVRSEELLDEAAEHLSEDAERERARQVIARRRIPDERADEKLVRHLMSKGFSYGVASEVVKERLKDDEDL